MTITVQKLHDDAQPPRRATEGSAGYDLHAYLRGRTIKCSDGQRTWDAAADADHGADAFVLYSGVTALIPLGFKAQTPGGHRSADSSAQRNELQEGTSDPKRAGHDRLGLSR